MLTSMMRFNGAVTFSLRKSKLTNTDLDDANLLQWGRNFFVTEIESKPFNIRVRDNASMGP